MIPFAPYLRGLRQRSGMRQDEFAAMLGYEQSYVSALEVGKRGPPSEAFLTALEKKLNLNQEEKIALVKAVEQSRRHFTLPHEAPTDIFVMCNELWERIDCLHPAQVQLIRELVKLSEAILRPAPATTPRVRRRIKKEVQM